VLYKCIFQRISDFKGPAKELKNCFIATQAPLALTIETFWDMIYQQNTEIVIMLCETSDKSHSVFLE